MKAPTKSMSNLPAIAAQTHTSEAAVDSRNSYTQRPLLAASASPSDTSLCGDKMAIKNLLVSTEDSKRIIMHDLKEYVASLKEKSPSYKQLIEFVLKLHKDIPPEIRDEIHFYLQELLTMQRTRLNNDLACSRSAEAAATSTFVTPNTATGGNLLVDVDDEEEGGGNDAMCSAVADTSAAALSVNRSKNDDNNRMAVDAAVTHDKQQQTLRRSLAATAKLQSRNAKDCAPAI